MRSTTPRRNGSGRLREREDHASFRTLYPAARGDLAAEPGPVAGGSVAYSLLPVASLPDVDFPVIGVGAGLPGASPETMASAVATPLERQFGRIAGREPDDFAELAWLGQSSRCSSISTATSTPQRAMCRLPSMRRAANCPSYLPQNPSYRKANPADAPILILTLTSDVVPKPQIYDLADSILAQKIVADPGSRPGFCRRQRAARRCASN